MLTLLFTHLSLSCATDCSGCNKKRGCDVSFPFIFIIIVMTDRIFLGWLGTTVLTDQGYLPCQPLRLTQARPAVHHSPSVFISHTETAQVLHCGLRTKGLSGFLFSFRRLTCFVWKASESRRQWWLKKYKNLVSWHMISMDSSVLSTESTALDNPFWGCFYGLFGK